MQKSLLLGACALMGIASANALPTAPKSLPLQNITHISPDGRFIVSEEYGSIIITDLENNKEYSYEADQDSDVSYGAGNGNTFSNTGIMVGCTSTNGDPAYWDAADGEWHMLPNPDGRAIWLAGINLDGTMIVGSGNVVPADNAPSGLLNLPMVWTLGEDGKWNEPVMLPHPVTDFSGRTLQYVYAHLASADGNTIFGHTQDYSGTMNFPILYTKDAQGKWSYKLLAEDTINPNHYTLPEFIEDAPVAPVDKDYMTEEQRANYESAFQAWIDSMYDQALFPNAEDYMTGENLEKYLADCQAYNEEAAKYNEWLVEYYTIFEKIVADTPMFDMNIIYMDAAGTKGIMKQTRLVQLDPDDYWSTVEYINPYTFDLVTDEHNAELINGEDQLYPSAMTSDGTMLAYGGSAQHKAYIKFPGQDWAPLYDFIKANADEETCTWMEENLVHSFEFANMMTGENVTFTDEPMIGKACASDNLKLFASSMENYWGDNYDDPDYAYTYGYLIPAVNATSIRGVNAESTLSVKAQRGGIIALNEAADVDVYDLQGRRVFSAKGISGNVTTGLESGIYTVKATSGSNSKVLKAQF